ncbi:MAG TPA: hypothetical protein PLG47_02940 [Candidatus Dojkabacteria bacterium]|nr:hypothetical protein [Candidatus Dojkabacteria bacterium]
MIPTSFNLLGHTVNVVFDDKSMDDKNALGCCSPTLNTITLTNKNGIDTLPQDVIEHTYWHEVVHFILKTMGEEELYKNEKFVDLFAALLHQILKTSNYN